MWCKFGRSISFRLENWYTMIYHRNGDVQIKTPLQWWWIYEIPPRSDPRWKWQIGSAAAFAMFVVWWVGKLLSFLGRSVFLRWLPFLGFFRHNLAQNRMNFQVLRKTSGRSLGANLSCTFDREFPTKRRGTPRVKKRVNMVAGPRDSCSCSCGWYPPDIELAPADAWWKEAIRHETENRWCLGIGCEGNRFPPWKKMTGILSHDNKTHY